MILVTGGNGFQGMPLCECLAEKGQDVLSIARHPVEDPRYQSARADITDSQALRALFEQYPIQQVIHLVSLLATKSSNNPDLATRINVIGTLNLLELCREKGVRRFVYGSSYNALGYYPPTQTGVDETTEPLPNNFYGETKRYIEKMGTRFAELNDIEFISGRLSILVGPGEPTATSAWRSNMFNLLESGGQIHITFPPQELLPVADVRDTAEALALLALAEKPAHTLYNIPSQTLTASQIASLVKKAGREIEITFGDKKVNDMPPRVNSSRIQQEFNYQPQTLETRLQAYREELRKCL